jgi:hypothetical protein
MVIIIIIIVKMVMIMIMGIILSGINGNKNVI